MVLYSDEASLNTNFMGQYDLLRKHMIHIPFYQWKFLEQGDPILKDFFSPIFMLIIDEVINEFPSF